MYMFIRFILAGFYTFVNQLKIKEGSLLCTETRI